MSQRWSTPTPVLSDHDRTVLSDLALNGKLGSVSAALQALDKRIEGVELIGDQVVVKFYGIDRRLPFNILGDGAYRILDLALLAADQGSGTVGLDEMDMGLHHSALPQLWKLVRTGIQTQIFATTHREESVLAAAIEFAEADDDRLRVIRLDRTDDGHRAVTYTAKEALHAIESGWEIRG